MRVEKIKEDDSDCLKDKKGRRLTPFLTNKQIKKKNSVRNVC